MKVTLLVFAAFMQIRSTEAADGSNPYFFSDQANWKDLHADWEDCGGEEQSPIDIITADTIHDPVLDTVPFVPSPNFYQVIEDLKCENSGQSYTCTLGSTATDRTMSGGGLLGGTFKLLQFHVHFGSSSSFKGSEHRVNSYQYPAEIHFVFQKSTIADLTNAVYGDLAVWGFFIEVVSNGHEKLGSFAKILTKIADDLNDFGDDTTTTLNSDILLSEMIPLDYNTLGSFYRYKGGLTTPGCNEWVQWTVFKNPIYISEAQYNQMTGGKSWPATPGQSDFVDMINTFRKPQPLNGRPVTRSKLAGDPEMVGSSKVGMHSSVLCLVTLAMAKLLLQ